MTVVGARPQFIKASAISRAVAGRPDVCDTIVHTGQHFDDAMSRVFFTELSIPEPAANLGISGGSHAQMVGRMLTALEEVMQQQPPDAVIVHGDTNSTLAGALAAAKLDLPVAHVEAGLRSFNRRMPEEINRLVADRVADLLLCPTPTAVENLRAEGISDGVCLTGDVMYDTAVHYGRVARERSDVLQRLGLTEGAYCLATLHRAENTDDAGRLRAILSALEAAPRSVVMPVHPRTRLTMERAGLHPGGIRVTDPVSYLDMLRLEQAARVILTDSGGLQKEAYFAGVPCVTLRGETEWVELVDAGRNRLAGADPDAIAEAIRWAEDADRTSPEPSLYGDGHAAEHVVEALVARYGPSGTAP